MGRKIWNFLKWTIFVLVAVLIGLVIFFLIIGGKEESILKSELNKFSNQDLAVDNYTVKIKTKGDYVYIENEVKKFYKELADNVKDINNLLSNDDFINILAVEKLQQQRPSYFLSHVNIKSTRNKINTAIENIKQLSNEKKFKNLIKKEKFKIGKDYFYNLFIDYAYTEEALLRLSNTKDEMETLSEQLNTYLDKIEEILNFLQKNDDDLKFSNKGEISFEDEDNLDNYKKLYNEIEQITNEFNLKNAKEA